MWAGVLGMEEARIDRQDNLFDLGADSISAMKLVAAARSEDLHIRVLDVFQNPVLWKLAAATSLANGSAPQRASQQVYRPFQLLGSVPDIGVFLEEVVCPVTRTPKDSIVDAFLATDAVAFNVVGALTSSQTEVNTLFLDTDAVLDLDRLRQSYIMLAKHVEAFRTVFVLDPNDGKLLQVILDSYQHNVQRVKVRDTIESATQRLAEEEFCRPFQLGRPMIDMAILHHEQSSKTRVLFRMSHALYDGPSLPIIWDTLHALYDRQGAFETQLTPFSAYLHDLLPHTTDKSYTYWRGLLKGAEMPALSTVTKSNTQGPVPMAFTGNKTVAVSRLKDTGITISAVINCAWAHVLAQYTGSDDAVFGDTISGRNLVDPVISSTLVGCCATHVPVRVRFDRSGKQTLLELLHQVRDQQRSRIAHEGLGFRAIIREAMPKPMLALDNWQPADKHGKHSPQEEVVKKGKFLEQTVDTGLTTLEEIWFSVFTPKGGKAESALAESGPTREMRQMPFYDLGGDLLDAAYFVALIGCRRKTSKRSLNGQHATDSDAEVTIDHVIIYPSLGEFVGFLHTRQISLG
ncbi:condensation domain-containing protein [Emericellopsis atlantica]|uniref:Condensation domain-containing protein n=1 Tax=Emericellopsis atlantica TaxID=2614577 RepID=A0A9P7ZSC5_9HYPO|nr:condensation domain-containing protein [Emericellopsis atlantica]KAG9256805.1 condensation domain-containing protein [Emericellopsis atlantica]